MEARRKEILSLNRNNGKSPGKAVSPSEREGVFAHSFICNNCGLHFMLFSWFTNRHGAKNVNCPECGNKGSFRHWRKTLEEGPKFTLGNEIFRYCPFHGSNPMADTVRPETSSKPGIKP